MAPTKGVHAAIEVARTAGLPLRIAAKMWEREEVDYFHNEVAPHLDGAIEFVGEVGGRDKDEFLGAAIALINPIDWDEPFGLNMIESLACGTPVVATPRGSVPEIVEHGRTGFVASTVVELAEAAQAATTLDRAACRHTAEQRFSAARMATEHAVLYDGLVAPPLVRLNHDRAARASAGTLFGSNERRHGSVATTTSTAP